MCQPFLARGALHAERSLVQRVGVIKPFSQHRLFTRVADGELVPVTVGFAADFVLQTLPLLLEEPDHYLSVSDRVAAGLRDEEIG